MKVLHIHWLDKPSREAKVEITDGNNTIIAFSHPCDYTEGQEIQEDLIPTDPRNLQISDSEITKFEKIKDYYFGYLVIARVIDHENSILAVGDIKMEIHDRIPSWAGEGDIIQFKTPKIELL